jgi:hypothetical protein
MGEGMRNLNEVESEVAQIGSFWWAVADLQDYRPRVAEEIMICRVVFAMYISCQILETI